MSRTELTAALAVWRATRAAAIADAIDGLSEAARAGWEPPKARKSVDFHAAWLAAASDEVQRGWALTTLLDKLPGIDNDARGDALTARLEHLRAAGPDPRVAREVARLLELDPPIMGNTYVDDKAREILVEFVDERLRAQLAAMTATADKHLAEHIAVVAKARPTSRAATRAELARFAAHTRPPPPKAADTAALFREVYAHPASNDARVVLADVLQAQGDPRGEFVALQLAGEAERSEALLAKHGKDWLGELRKVTYRCRFERGFVSRLELAGKWTATPAAWAKVAANPMLGTVEDLLVGQATSEVYKQLALSPATEPALRAAAKQHKLPLELAAAPRRIGYVTGLQK